MSIELRDLGNGQNTSKVFLQSLQSCFVEGWCNVTQIRLGRKRRVALLELPTERFLELAMELSQLAVSFPQCPSMNTVAILYCTNELVLHKGGRSYFTDSPLSNRHFERRTAWLTMKRDAGRLGFDLMIDAIGRCPARCTSRFDARRAGRIGVAHEKA